MQARSCQRLAARLLVPIGWCTSGFCNGFCKDAARKGAAAAAFEWRTICAPPWSADDANGVLKPDGDRITIDCLFTSQEQPTG